MKIDIFCHIFPQPFYDRMMTHTERAANMQKRVREIPVLTDVNLRLRIMDQFPGYQQVFCLGSPPIEEFGDPKVAPELARIGNDGMADICAKYPDRFPGFIASVAMNNMPECMKEIERSIEKLNARGIQIFTNVNGRPLDEPEFRQLFERMAAYDLPIWLHPARPSNFPDYITEKKSKFELWWVFGWPYETSIAMSRIVFAGIFDEFPNLKIIAHHMGAMIPYFEGRVGPGLEQLGKRTPETESDLVKHSLKRSPLDYFRMFCGDTALFGAVAPLECGLAFFGIDQILFASDMPFDPEKGPGFIRETIRAIDAMSIAPADREKIYEGNAKKLLKLP